MPDDYLRLIEPLTTTSFDECKRGTVRASNENRMLIGAKAMRSILALGLLITLCACAATLRHSRYHVIVHPSQSYAVPGWAYAGLRPPVGYDDTPSYNDPSKFGGGTALPATP